MRLLGLICLFSAAFFADRYVTASLRRRGQIYASVTDFLAYLQTEVSVFRESHRRTASVFSDPLLEECGFISAFCDRGLAAAVGCLPPLLPAAEDALGRVCTAMEEGTGADVAGALAEARRVFTELSAQVREKSEKDVRTAHTVLAALPVLAALLLM